MNYFRLLQRNPGYARLWAAQAVSLVGDWFNTIVLASLVAKYSESSGLAISLLLLARFLPPLLVSPIAGVLLDRFDRRKMLIVSDIARIFIVLGFLLVQSAEQLWLVYALTVAQFCFSSVFEPGRSALLPSLVQRDDLVEANILGSVTWSVMLAIGGILGGYAMYFLSGKKYNPVTGIAGVSCVPTTSKVAQKSVGPGIVVLPHALGANISGVITSAIFAATFIALLLPKG